MNIFDTSWTSDLFKRSEFPISGDLIIKDKEGKMFAYGVGYITYGEDDINYTINIKDVRYPIPESKVIKINANDYPTIMRFVFYPINDRIRKIESDFAKLDASLEINFFGDYTETSGRITPLLHDKELLKVYPCKQ